MGGYHLKLINNIHTFILLVKKSEKLNVVEDRQRELSSKQHLITVSRETTYEVIGHVKHKDGFISVPQRANNSTFIFH